MAQDQISSYLSKLSMLWFRLSSDLLLLEGHDAGDNLIVVQ